ncbi:MAG: amidohydrolase [Pirellulales bacterium]
MPRCNRRDFAKAALAGLAAASLAADRPAMEPLIDTHTHFYDPTRPQGVPWPGKGDDRLYRAVLPPEFSKLTAPLGVTGTVVVEASPWLEDNQWLLDLADRETAIVGVVGNLTPGGEGFAGHLERFTQHRLFRGIRIGHDLLRKHLSDKVFVADVRRLAEHDLELDINGGPDMPADVARLAKLVPDLRIVINHEANVRIDGNPPPRGWLDGMAAAAAQPGVFCKVSALAEGAAAAGELAPVETDFYRPILDAVWKAFGEDRLIYGSNWPVSNRATSYPALLKIVREYFTEKGPQAASKYFHRNALEAYKWVQRPGENP